MLSFPNYDLEGIKRRLGQLPYDTLLIRLSGEIPIKSEGVRRYWERKLSSFLSRYIRELGYHNDIKVFSERGRLYLFFNDIISSSNFDIIEKVIRTFGFSSISLAMRCVSDIEELKKCLNKFVSKYIEVFEVKTFGIIAKKSLSPLFGTTELRYDLGAFVKDKFNLKVNLDNPDLPIIIDAREDFTYIYTENIPCYGGLPFGVQEPLTVMFSGGPDSTLASWLTLRRGSPITLVYFDFGDKKLRIDAKIRALKVAEVLFKDWTPISTGELIIVPFDSFVRAIFRNVDDRNYYYVLLKRMMYRVASILNKMKNGHGIVTGEIIGEHASQTVWNLSVLSHNIDTPIFRPVLGFDKSDVFKTLKSIDSRLYEFSSKSIEPCKIITGVKPTTKADMDKMLFYEKKVIQELGDELENVMKNIEIIKF